jgi:hypothetical protein
MRELIEKYAWADEDENLVLTLAVVTGSSVGDLVSVYGGGDVEPVMLTHDDAWVPQEDFGAYFHVQAFTEGPFTVLIEPNGWTGSIAEIARRASVGGRFLSVAWSMAGTRRITEAERGSVLASFNPFLVAEPAGGGDLVPDWVEDVPFDIGRPNASSLAAVEARAGIEVAARWLAEPLPTYRIPDPDELLKDVPNPRVP